jgi:hypothetical protein
MRLNDGKRIAVIVEHLISVAGSDAGLAHLSASTT